ncbi:hypothetical protein DFH28DRAFT_960354 [Melampsora americana]|nr:hypothetical protein DFH28DRAFT_960354 [Melampsora americana]
MVAMADLIKVATELMIKVEIVLVEMAAMDLMTKAVTDLMIKVEIVLVEMAAMDLMTKAAIIQVEIMVMRLLGRATMDLGAILLKMVTTGQRMMETMGTMVKTTLMIRKMIRRTIRKMIRKMIRRTIRKMIRRTTRKTTAQEGTMTKISITRTPRNQTNLTRVIKINPRTTEMKERNTIARKMKNTAQLWKIVLTRVSFQNQMMMIAVRKANLIPQSTFVLMSQC